MIKKFLIITIFLLVLLLACCVAPNSPEIETTEEISETPIISDSIQTEKIEYIKITPQEAHDMMTDNNNVVILDVRTQEEFDEGHITNAVLLPDYEIGEKAERVLADKNQTILIYCRTGRRSEIAARELIDMGYTKVFDFGGITDWPYEIVRGVSNTLFYNYFGGDLPDDIITFIDFRFRIIAGHGKDFDQYAVLLFALGK